MDEFTRLKQLADDYAATMAAFDSARHDTDDLISATAARLQMERALTSSRIAELRKTAADTSRSETVRRVAAVELEKLKGQTIAATPEECAAVTELIEQQKAAVRDIKAIRQAAKPAADEAVKQVQALRESIMGSEIETLAPRWIEGQQKAFDKLSVGGAANGAEAH